MKRPEVNFKQYQKQPEGSGKMLKLVVLVIILLLLGWLVTKGLNQLEDKKEPMLLEDQRIEHIELDTTNF